MNEPAYAISAAQCRAARALLDWSQDELAENARVARPTIADFERQSRFPMRNNLLAIIAAFEAAGVSFVSENGEGAGVRFRKVELEYSKSLKPRGDDLIIQARYRGDRVDIVVSREILDDIDRTSYRTADQRLKAVQEHLHQFLGAAERRLSADPMVHQQSLVLRVADFPAGTF